MAKMDRECNEVKCARLGESGPLSMLYLRLCGYNTESYSTLVLNEQLMTLC